MTMAISKGIYTQNFTPTYKHWHLEVETCHYKCMLAYLKLSFFKK